MVDVNIINILKLLLTRLLHKRNINWKWKIPINHNPKNLYSVGKTPHPRSLNSVGLKITDTNLTPWISKFHHIHSCLDLVYSSKSRVKCPRFGKGSLCSVFFSMANNLSFCHDIPGLMNEHGVSQKPTIVN